MFYTYEQNNSGGYYEVDDIVAHVVIVEADNADDADSSASKKGVFSYYDCECCGERFSRQSERFVPHEGYVSIKEALKQSDWMRSDRQVRVHFKDGSVSKEVQS